MEKEKKDNEGITRKDLEEQTQVLLVALDTRLDNIKDELKTDIKDELKADIKELKNELYIVRDELKADINSNQTLIDGYVKAQEDFKDEHVIIKEEVKQMKNAFKEKLGVEISAV